MKKYLLLLFAISFYGLSNGQRVSIAVESMNILYVGLDNPIAIAVENYPCKSIIVKTDNGSIDGNSCKYIIRPNKIGKTDIILYKKVNGQLKEIGRSSFRAKAIPDPVPKVGPSAGGYINKVVLRNQQFIRAEYECCGFDARATIESFTVSIIRDDNCLYQEIKNVGSGFNDELIKALTTIKKDDTLIFKKILAQGMDGSTIPLTPLMLVVTD